MITVARFQLRSVQLGLGALGLSLLVAIASFVPTNAGLPSRIVRIPGRSVRPFAAQLPYLAGEQRPMLRPGRTVLSPVPCSTNTPGAFVGVKASNHADGEDSAVLGGLQNSACDDQDAIGGGNSNDIGSGGGAGASFIGAGGGNGITSIESMVGAGFSNSVSGDYSFVGAGESNQAGGYESFIGSGAINTIGSAGEYATILGGNRNSAGGEYASILGGFGNTANGSYAIVAGGDADTADGTLSFAGGYHADAGHNGSFVWSDFVSGSATLRDSATNQFVVRASGGTYIYSNETVTTGVALTPGSGTWASLSDRNAKTDIVPLDDASILAKVAALPIDAWRYKSEKGVRHVGPMAQDFYASFGTGADDRHITSIDEDGVALAAIKALHGENGQLRRDNGRLRAQVSELRSDFDHLAAKVEALRPRER
jgi:Chaperone of endosialidase